MSDINVNVQDTTYVKSNTINKVLIRIMNVDLFNSITVCASLFENTTLVDNKVFKIEGTEYSSWGTDDNYIVNLVLSKLGMTPA